LFNTGILVSLAPGPPLCRKRGVDIVLTDHAARSLVVRQG
jgi:hypothetical protein